MLKMTSSAVKKRKRITFNERWSEEETFALLRSRIKYDNQYFGGNPRPRTAWNKILTDANLEHRGQAECQKKWRNILIRYREIQLRVEADPANKQTYTEHWPFYLTMHRFSVRNKRAKGKMRKKLSMVKLQSCEDIHDSSVVTEVVPTAIPSSPIAPAEICAECDLDIDESYGIQCNGDCGNLFHLTRYCTGTTQIDLQKLIATKDNNESWACKPCTKKRSYEIDEKNYWRQVDRIESEIDENINEINLDGNSLGDDEKSEEDFKNLIEYSHGVITNADDLYFNTMKLTEDPQTNFDDILDMKNHLKLYEVNFERFNHEIRELEHENAELKSKIEELEAKQHRFDQLSLNDEIQIVALPQMPNENLQELFLLICSSLLDVTMDPGSIVKCYRTPQRYNNIPNIVVKLKDQKTQRSILRNRKGKFFSTIALGIVPGKIFYINERLTEYYSELYKRAKDLKKIGLVKLVWVDGGRILVRKDDESQIIIINHENKLKEFGIYE